MISTIVLLLVVISVVPVSAIAEEDVQPTIVFLLAGQSNMDGRGDGSKLTEDDLQRLAAVRDRVLLAYNGSPPTPLHVTQPLGHVARRFELELVFGPELFFGIRMAEAFPDRNILLIKRSLGGTSLYGAWHPDWDAERATLMNEEERPRLFGELVADIERVIGDTPRNDYELAGMLWVQGETDSNVKKFGSEPSETYGENLTQLIAAIREVVAVPDLPFHMLQVGNKTVVDGMKETAKRLDNVYFIPQSRDPESARYLPKYGPPIGHYNYEGMKRIGNLFADSCLNEQ